MGRFLVSEMPRVILRLAAALTLYALVTAIPLPPTLGQWIAVGAFAALAASILIICGTLLYDTLFYERHWRHLSRR